MLEEHVRNILESKSMERLDEFPLDEVEKALKDLESVTYNFFTPVLDWRKDIRAEDGSTRLKFGAQLNNRLVNSKTAKGFIQRWKGRRNPPGPENYRGLVENLDRQTREILFTSDHHDFGKVMTSYSVVGTITRINEGYTKGRLLRKRTPFLLVPNEEISPEIGSSDFSLIFQGQNDWSKIDESMYDQAMEELSAPTGMGYRDP